MNFEVALKLFKKYGFNSNNDSPYLSYINNKVGIAIKYVDKCFGRIERTCLFEDYEKFEVFLKLYRAYIDHGKNEGIYIKVDDYRAMFPNIIFIKDEKLVLSDELLNGFLNKDSLSEVEKLKVVAKNLLNYYKDLSFRQVEYINKVSFMKGILLNKEKELDEELRKIKKRIKNNKQILIKEELFRYDDTLYKDYENYLDKVVTKDHAIQLIKCLWNFNKKLELSNEYYDSIKAVWELGEKIKLVDSKIAYVKSLKGKNLLLVNVKANLKQIEANFNGIKIDPLYKENELNKVIRKYEKFDNLSIYQLDEYLKESSLYDNYEYIANKYTEDVYRNISKKEVIDDLCKSYQLLSFDERKILTLFNSKYRKIFDLILKIPDFYEWPNKKMTKYLEEIEEVSRFKEECIDELCIRLVQETNRKIKEKYFTDINFKSFKYFVQDMVKLLIVLKNINDKMTLKSDLKLFMDFDSLTALNNKYVYYLEDNSNSVIGDAITKKRLIGVFKILKETPVLYSPYNLDFGNLYDKNSRRISEVSNNKIGLIIDVNDVKIMRDRKLSEVYDYENIKEEKNGVFVVTDIKYRNKISYCNFTIYKR